MAATQDGLNIKSTKLTDIVNGISTDVACYNFANRIFILLTQFQRPGTMIHIEKQDACQNVYSSSNTIEISTEVLLGIDDPIYQVYAKKIASIIFKETKKPILLAIALKDREPSSIPSLSQLILRTNTWSL